MTISSSLLDTMHQIKMILITVLIFQHFSTMATNVVGGLKVQSLHMTLPIAFTREVLPTRQASPRSATLSVSRLHQQVFYSLSNTCKERFMFSFLQKSLQTDMIYLCCFMWALRLSLFLSPFLSSS